MKKLTLIAVLLSLSVASQAQKAVLFKYRYLPKHTYSVNTKNDMYMEMTMGGDSAMNAQLAAGGMKNPILMKMNMEMGYSMKTEAENATKKIPFTLTYTTINIKATANGVETPIPQNPLVGQVVKGECETDGKLSLTEFTGTGVSDQLKDALKQMVNKMATYIKFPEKPIAIGESFTMEMPMSMPAAGMSMDFNVKTVYKLTDIKDNLAYFDSSSDFDMNINTETNGVTVTGKGTGGGPGKMVFDIKNSFPKTQTGDMDMNFNMDIKTMKMGMKIKAKTSITNELAAN